MSTAKRRFSIDEILACKIPTEVSAGPGSRIAFTLREADREESTHRAHLWVVEPGSEPVRLTRGEKNANTPRWSPDGRHLAFLTNRPNGKAGDEGPRTQVWLLPAGGGEAFCLTRAEKGIRSYRWMPDGRSILYVADEPEQEAVKARQTREKKQKLDAIVEHEGRRRRQIFLIEAKEGAEPKRIHAGDLGLNAVNISPDGRYLVYNTNYTGIAEDSLTYDLWLLEIATGKSRRLTSGTGGCWGATFSPDSTQIAFFAPREPKYSYSRSELFVVPSAGGDLVNLTDRNPALQGDVTDLAWESDEALLVAFVEATSTQIYRYVAATGEATRLTRENEVVFGGFDLSADGRTLAYVSEGPLTMPEVVQVDLKGAEGPVTLTNLNPFLQTEIEWGTQEVITWENEGWRIDGILALPPTYKQGERLPLLVYVHGGPKSRTPNTLRQYFSFQALAAQGYAVLAPNYRGGAGRGNAFAVANRSDLGGGDFRDIMAGVDHLITSGIADGERMGILGGSYGGYMTNWAIGQTDRFKAAVSLFGIFSLVTDYSQSDWPGWELGYLDGYWWENPEPYTRCAPATYVTNMKTPVLIIHGDADNNTNPANSREMYQSLRHLGRTVQYVRYPREGHGLQEPNHKRDEYRRVFDWFRHYLLQESAVAEGTVERDGASLTPTVTAGPAAYSGRRPKGRFVELLLQVTPGSQPLKLDLGEMRLKAEEGVVTWEVGVAGVVAGSLLIPAGGPVEIGSPAALSVVFDLPEEASTGDWQLESSTFPLVAITFR